MLFAEEFASVPWWMWLTGGGLTATVSLVVAFRGAIVDIMKGHAEAKVIAAQEAVIRAKGDAEAAVIRANGEVQAKVTLARAEAEARALEAKAKREDGDQAVGQWRELYRTTREELGRLVAHVDELSGEMGRVRADGEECRAEYADLYMAYEQDHASLVACAEALARHGEAVAVAKKVERRPPRQSERAEREFRQRQLAQDTALLSKQGREVLALPEVPPGGK